MPNPQEVATIVAAGVRFDEWTTVFVQHRWTESETLFRFSTADVILMPDTWEKLQFKPGDRCAIYLGRQLAVHGVITIRQVAYDKGNHGVMLQGKGLTWYAGRGSILDKSGSFDKMSFEEIARKVLLPFGINPEVVGVLDATKFETAQAEKTDTVWTFLERLARHRGIIMGSDNQGNLLLIGDHSYGVVADLEEGRNILKMQCIISLEHVYSQYFVDAQTTGNDQRHGRQASELRAVAPGTAQRYSPLLTPAEHPVAMMPEVQRRAAMEAKWHEGTIIIAHVTVQGWFDRVGQLWKTGSNVHVKSPMAMLNQVLKIKTATFTQDRNSGTLTTLELVAPWYLNDRPVLGVGPQEADPNPPPEPATPQHTPAETPPAGTVIPPAPPTLPEGGGGGW